MFRYSQKMNATACTFALKESGSSFGLPCQYGLLLSSILLLPCSYADLRDPTTPVYMPALVEQAPQAALNTPAIKAPVIEAPLPVLSAIWIAPHSKRVTLNGVTAKEGETILDNIEIIKISTNRVDIKQNHHLKTLQLLPSTQQH